MLFALALACQVVQAAPAVAPVPKADIDSGSIQNQPLGGLVINRTITVLGWNFYSNFATVWRNLYPDTPFTVTVYERPTAQFGSEIWIDYDGRHVFHTFLPPAIAATRQISTQAASVVYKTITTLIAKRALYNDIDLAPEEIYR